MDLEEPVPDGVTSTASSRCFAVRPDEFLALQWHGNTYRLPEGAVQLARSDAYEQQAFAVRRAYGL
jgi:GMP synthase-like glutamine amidotransferase